MMKNSKPALLGGKPAVSLDQIKANRWPVITEEDEQAVIKVMRDGDISTHSVIGQLEQDYREYFEMPYALAHCNGTAALLAAFWAIGLKPGDEVLVPSATFWASVLPMMWLGALPVFCESEEHRLGIDPQDMERRITSKTKAIVVVHLWGMPSRMTEITSIAKKYNLKIVEDASHAHGATWRERPCGTLGDIAVFSLQGHKLAPAGEGGVLMCRNYDYWERAACLGDMTKIMKLETGARRFAGTTFGIKTRIAPVSAAIACGQLKRLAENNERRTENIEYLSRQFERFGFNTYMGPEHVRRVYFEYIIAANENTTSLPLPTLIAALSAEGCIVAHPRYPLLHQQPYFTEGAFLDVLRSPSDFVPPAYLPEALPRTQAFNKRLLKLPSFPWAEIALLDQYALAFEKVLDHADEIRAHYPEEELQ